MNERKAGEAFQPCLLREGIAIPAALLKDPTLSASARVLWGILAAYQGTSLECFPLEEALAAPLGVKVRQLQSYLKELENYKRGDPPQAFPLLAVTRVWVEKDQKTRNSYSLLSQPFIAYRSGEDTQNTYRAPPGISSEHGSALPAGIPPGDPQSSVHADGDVQERAVGWPAIPEDGGTLPHGLPSSDAQYPARRSGANPQDSTAERSAIPDEDGRRRSGWSVFGRSCVSVPGRAAG